MISKWGTQRSPQTSLPETWLRGKRYPALRWREFNRGFCKEMGEPVVLMTREKSKWLNHKGESTDARHWGGAVRSSDEVSVMEIERRDCVRLLNQFTTRKRRIL